LDEKQGLYFGLDVKQQGHIEFERHKKTALDANPGGFSFGRKGFTL
jgi:hypothetical protein